VVWWHVVKEHLHQFPKRLPEVPRKAAAFGFGRKIDSGVRA
jgi:hypothetical protein